MESSDIPPRHASLRRWLRFGSVLSLIVAIVLMLGAIVLGLVGGVRDWPAIFLLAIVFGVAALLLQFLLTAVALMGRVRFSLGGMLCTVLVAGAAVSALVSGGIVLQGLGVGVLIVMVFVLHDYARRETDE